MSNKIPQTREEWIVWCQEETRRRNVQSKIDALKEQLAATDYKAIKYAEGLIAFEEYEPVKQFRIGLRNRINELEASK